MKTALLHELIEARGDRQQILIMTDLQSGDQQLIKSSDEYNGHKQFEEAISGAFSSGESRVIQRENREFFLHVHNPRKKICIIGAVHIAQKLIPIASETGYDCIVIDPREAFATGNRFEGVQLFAEWPQDILSEISLDPWTAFVALTHDPKIDDPALCAALKSNCFYIGALGSRNTHRQRCDRLKDMGISEIDLDRVNAPIGLDIKARGPAEIAVSVIAEITLAFRNQCEEAA